MHFIALSFSIPPENIRKPNIFLFSGGVFRFSYFIETDQWYKMGFLVFLLLSIFDVLRDLVPFVQFKKRKKHPWRSITFSKV